MEEEVLDLVSDLVVELAAGRGLSSTEESIYRKIVELLRNGD